MATYFLTCFTLLSCFTCCLSQPTFTTQSPPTVICTLPVYLNCKYSMNITKQMCTFIKNYTKKQNDTDIDKKLSAATQICPRLNITNLNLNQNAKKFNITDENICILTCGTFFICMFRKNLSSSASEIFCNHKMTVTPSTAMDKTELRNTPAKDNSPSNKSGLTEEITSTLSNSIPETKHPSNTDQHKNKNASNGSGSTIGYTKPDVLKNDHLKSTKNITNAKNGSGSTVGYTKQDVLKNDDPLKSSKNIINAKNGSSSTVGYTKPDDALKNDDQQKINKNTTNAKNGTGSSIPKTKQDDETKQDDKTESQKLFVSKNKNSKQEKSLLPSQYNDTPSSAHFMGYFLTAIVLCIAGYVVFHNKQKIIAFIIEGRNQKRSRRPNSGEYRKLQTSVDDVMSSIEKSTTSHNYIY